MAHGLIKQLQIEKKGHQVLDQQFAAQGQSAAKIDDDNDTQRRCEMDKRLKSSQQPERVQKRALVILDPDADSLRLQPFPGKGLDFTNTGEIVLQYGVELTQFSLAFAKGRAYVLGKPSHSQDDDWYRNQGQ